MPPVDGDEDPAAAAAFADGEDDDDTDGDDFPDADAAAAIPEPFPAPSLLDLSASNPNRNPSPVTSATAGGGERRPLFQRLWTEEDEIVILRGFAEFTAARGTAFASHQYDTDPFYEDMRRRLQLDFSKSQLVEKLRRLKRKYRNCVSRLRAAGAAFSFRSPHEQAIFEIARNIWRPSNKHGRDGTTGDSDDDDTAAATAAAAAAAAHANPNPNGEARTPGRPRRRRRRTLELAAASDAAAPMPVPVKVEESLPVAPVTTPTPLPVTVTIENSEPTPTPPPPPPPPPQQQQQQQHTPPSAAVVSEADKNCLTPLFKEMINAMIGIGGPAPLGPLQLSLGWKSPESLGLPMEGEKWRQQRILELEVYLKRIELLQDQVKSALEELRSSPGT